VSAPDAPLLEIRTREGAAEVRLRAVRKGALPELPPIIGTVDPYAHLTSNTGAKSQRDGGLSTNSMVSDLLGDPRARAILEREVPDLVSSPQIGMASQMTLRALQPFMPQLLSNAALDRIERALAERQR
jgi:hypothetical protein